MAGEIASTFVRIRPNTAGFQQEAERGIKSSLLGIGKIIGGIFAAQTAVTGIRDIANAAAQHEAAFAVLTKTIEDANAATVLFGKGIEKILTKEGELKGFNDEDLASSFTRLVSVTHNSKEALKDLGLAEDVARARHIDVATAALALSRAQQGSTISLSRLGIVIPKVSTQMARLRHEHDVAVAAGVKFTGQVGLQYKASVLAATAADKQATKIAALDVVQKRFGGTAATFAKTALGQFATFQQEIHNFEVAIGGALLPTLTAGAAGLGGFVHNLTVSGEAGRTAREIMAELGQVLHVLGDAFRLIAPPALAISHALLDVAGSIGIPGLLVAVSIYKGLGLALSIAGGAATRFRGLLAAGAAAQAAAASGANRTTAAEAAYANAVKAGTTAQAESIGPTEASTAAINANAAARERLGLTRVSTVTNLPAGGGAVNTQGAAAATAATAAQEQFRRAQALSTDAQLSAGLAAEATTRLFELQTLVIRAHTRAVELDAHFVHADAAAHDQLATAAGAAGFEVSTAIVGVRQGIEATSTAQGVARRSKGLLTAAEKAQLDVTRAQTAALAQQAAAIEQSTAVLSGGSATAVTAAGAQDTLAAATERDTAANVANEASTRAAAAGQLQLGGAASVATAQLSAASRAVAAQGVTTAAALKTSSVNLANASNAAAGARTLNLGSGSSTAVKAIEETGAAAARTGPKFITFASALLSLRVGALAVATGLRTLGSGLLALIGGPVTLGIAAFAGLGLLIFKLVTQESAAELAANRLRGSLTSLAGALDASKASARQYADALSSIKTDRIAADTAKLALEQARGQLATFTSARSSLAYRQALQQVKAAQDSYRLALRQIASDEKAASDAHQLNARNFAAAEEFRQKALKNSLDLLHQSLDARTGFLGKLQTFFNQPAHIPLIGVTLPGTKFTAPGKDFASPSEEQAAKRFSDGLHKQSEALKAEHPLLARQLQDISLITTALKQTPSEKVVRILIETGSANAALRALTREQAKVAPNVQSFVATLRAEAKAIGESDPALARRLRLLASFSAAIREIPDSHTTTLVLHAASFRAALVALIKELRNLDAEAKAEGNKSAAAFAEAFIKKLQGELRALDFANIRGKATTTATGLAAETTKELRNSLKVVDAAIAQTGSTIRTATEKLASAQKSLADAIRTGNQQIHDSIASADANLASIGDSISNMLGQFLDAQNKSGQAADISEAEFKRLRARLEAGNGGVGTQTAAEQAAFLAEKNQTAASTDLQDKKDRAARNIHDLIDQFNKGQITLRELNRGIAKVLEKDGFSYQKAGKLLGSFFVTGFKDAVTGISKQGAAILAVPAALRRGIDGQQPNIVKPLETIHQVNDSIRAAEKERKKDAAALAKDERLYAKERQRQHAITNELLRRRTVTAERPANTARALRVELHAALGVGAVTKPQLNDIIRLAQEAGLAIPQGLVQGIRTGGPHAGSETRKLAKILLAELRAALRSKSPSEAAREIGLDFGLGLALGISDSEAHVAGAVAGLLKSISRLTQPLFKLHPSVKGLVREGNLDLNARVPHRNRDGSISTERSVSIGVGGREVLIPTIVKGVSLSVKEAIAHFKATGENLGTFKTIADANRYATELHLRQERFYVAAQERLSGQLVRRAALGAEAVVSELRKETKVAALALAKEQEKLAHQRFEQHRLTNELLARGLNSSAAPHAIHQLKAEIAELLKDLKLTVRHETLSPARIAVAHVSAPVTAVRGDSDKEMLGELRAQRRTTAHGDELLLSEARRQTHALNEIVAAERRKPVHPKPSHAPGENARKARSAAHHNLVA